METREKEREVKYAPSSLLEVNGVSKSISVWASQLAVPVQTILGRLKRGWESDRAVSQAVGSGGSNRGTKQGVEVLTREEMKSLLEKCNDGPTGIRNSALIVLGWRAGLRISEAIALKPKDLDEAQQTIRILHGKGDKSRTVGLDQEAWQMLKKWIDARSLLAIDQKTELFCTLEGNKLSDRYVRSLMPRLAEAAGISKRVHFHALRHTMAFELAAEGVPMHLIQQQLGHSNLAITSRYISHLNPAETVARMKSRTWTERTTSLHSCSTPAPGWIDRLRADIGQRLFMFHDGRSDELDFKAIVVLF